MRFEIIPREFWVDIDSTYEIEIKKREGRYEVIACKDEDDRETFLSRHILECDAINQRDLIRALLNKDL